jgi:hypothetical protein
MATAEMNGSSSAFGAAARATPSRRPLFTGDVWDPKAHRRFWLDKSSAAIDAWLRSRAFLKLMQYGLRTAITFKRLQDRQPWSLHAAPVTKPTPRLDPRAGRKDLSS